MTATESIISRQLRPFLFGLLLVSSLAVKILHLRGHANSLSLLDWIVLLPFFFFQDVALAVIGRLLFAHSCKRRNIIDPPALGFLLTNVKLLTSFASAAEISFYWETSSEIDWTAARKFVGDPAGMKVLLSGTINLIIVYVLLLLAARATTPYVYEAVGKGLRQAVESIKPQVNRPKWNGLCFFQSGEDVIDDMSPLSPIEGCYKANRKIRRPVIIATVYLVILWRYAHYTDSPYGHLCGSLPFTLTRNSDSNDGEFCMENDELERRPFPFELVGTQKSAEETAGLFRGWVPWEFASGHRAPLESVDWLPKEQVTGFERWYYSDSSTEAIYYNPRWDPLRISNTHTPILEALQETFMNATVVIRNVMFITLESARKDIFPLKESSRMHEIIQQSHDVPGDPELYRLLANFSHTSESLTGEDSGFQFSNISQEIPTGSWTKSRDGSGGLNIQSATSSSTYTLKNLLSSHCGVGALPVDFAKEATQDIYQPCLPQILKLFDLHKSTTGNSSAGSHLAQHWDTAFVQSVTDQYDNQDVIIRKMGFNETVARAQIRDPNSKYYPPTEPEAHYFGYPETQAKPYMRDIIQRAQESGRRFFLSHMMSSTHHPWVLPASTQAQEFMGHEGWTDHSDLNSYLNTVKYSDGWLGQIMDMLEETKVINETLVVVTGDHGFAFREDDASFTTYNGAHVKNFKVPLVFYHPQLPRLHLPVQASTMSILPTILDLLASSGNLDDADRTVASHLLNEYEGQSLIREYQTTYRGRQAWHVSLINPGGAVLAISSAAFPYRLVMPLCHTAMFRFSDTARDVDEQRKVESWSIEGLSTSVAALYGAEAAKWAVQAKAVGTWWFWESRRLWKFGASSRQNITNQWLGHQDELDRQSEGGDGDQSASS